MSLILAHAKPEAVAKAMFGSVGIRIKKGRFTDIPYAEFVELVEYVLTNEDLFPADPRLALIKKLRKAKVVHGFNPTGRRITL
jgi:hypothetical protein